MNAKMMGFVQHIIHIECAKVTTSKQNKTSYSRKNDPFPHPRTSFLQTHSVEVFESLSHPLPKSSGWWIYFKKITVMAPSCTLTIQHSQMCQCCISFKYLYRLTDTTYKQRERERATHTLYLHLSLSLGSDINFEVNSTILLILERFFTVFFKMCSYVCCNRITVSQVYIKSMNKKRNSCHFVR